MSVRLSCLWLLFACVSVMSAPNSAPIEVPTQKDDLEEIQLKSSLEDRLARDLKAYLGASRFIINVDVSLEKIRQVVKQASQVSKAPGHYAQGQPYPKLRFPQARRQADAEVQDLPGLPFMEIPADKEKDAELQFMREQIKRLQQQQSSPGWDKGNNVNGNGNGEASDGVGEKTVAVFNRIKRLTINLIIEESVTQEQEVFLRNLVYKKAALNDLRGDALEIIRTRFSLLPKASVHAERTEAESGWINENFSALVLGLLSLLIMLLALIVLALRKRDEPSKTEDIKDVLMKSDLDAPPQIMAEENNDKHLMQKNRQEIISLGLGQPQHVQQVMDKLMGVPDKIPMVASLYKVLGRSLFRSIFPNVGQLQLQNVMTHLADQPPDDEQQHRDTDDFYRLLQQHMQNIEPAKALPFEFLNKLNDSQLLFLVQHEDVRIQALVISQLKSEQAARVLNRIAVKQQAQVVAELGQFETFPLDTFQDVADRLAKQAQKVPSFENVNADGLGMLISMLDSMSSGEEARVLKRLKQDKPDSFYRLRKQYFTFSDVLKTPKQVLSNALREVDRQCIGRAICNTPDAFKLHVLSSLTPKLKALAREDLKRSEGRIDAQEIDEARRSIVKKLREYLSSGKFSMDMLQQAKSVKQAQSR
ncbi:MAG: FliG C-terminal domain-containing protein [Bermanella sp.]